VQYTAFVTRDGGSFLVEFPDCPGCQTFAENGDEVLSVAREALEGWLEANLVERRVPPRPKRHRSAPAKARIELVSVPTKLSLALQVRWARQDREMSQTELAKLVGVSQQAIAKLEDPDANPTIETIERTAKALGLELEVRLGPPDRRS
jgi:predicted RNase H-like HicB family nuclease/DNA-binding XRE family transcriptional regulator